MFHLYLYYGKHWKNEAFYEWKAMYKTREEASEAAWRFYHRGDVRLAEVRQTKDKYPIIALGKLEPSTNYVKLG